MKKIGQFLIILISLCIFLTCDMQRADFLTPLSPVINAKNLQSIQITRASNPQLPADGLTVINENDITIYLSPDINSDTDSFILDIQAEGYDHFSVEGQTVQSGSTEIVFGHDVPRNFTIHGSDESTTEYTLRIVETLIGQVYSYDPRGNAPTEDQYFNTTVPFYVEFNSSIDAASIVPGDFSINGGFAVSQIRGINERIFMVDVDSVNTTPREEQITLVLQPHTVQDDDQTSTAVLNQNQSSSSVQWDSLPPGFNGIVEVEERNEGNTNLELRFYPWEDGVFPQDELRYSLYYSKGSAPGLNDAPVLNLNTLTSGTSVLEDFTINSTYYDVNVTGLEGQYKYCYFLKVQDALGNQALYKYDHMQSSFVYVSIQNGDNSTTTGNIDAPFKDILPAIEYAKINGITQVLVSEGTYNSVPSDSTDPNPHQISLPIYGDMELKGGYNSDFSQRYVNDPREFSTIISGDLSPRFPTSPSSWRLFELQSSFVPRPNENTLLEGFILTGASCPISNGGAAIASNGCFFKVKDCIFKNLHSAIGTGGAISLYDMGGKFIFENCTFQNCSADYGGAISIQSRSSQLELTNCNFIENSSQNNGGAVYVNDSSLTNLRDCIFERNISQVHGGALSLEGEIPLTNGGSNDVVMNVMNCDFYDNRATDGMPATHNHGGAIYVDGPINPGDPNLIISLQGNYFDGNYSQRLGGAVHIRKADIYLENSPGPTSRQNIFKSNSTEEEGGAFYITYSDFFLYDTIFEDNHAIGNPTNSVGGGVRITHAKGGIYRSEFRGNTSNGHGGALACYVVNLSMEDCEFSDYFDNTNYHHNSADLNGGAIYLDAFNAPLGENSIIGNSFRNCHSNSFGGAIYIEEFSKPNVFSNNLFEGNTSDVVGGAIYMYDVDDITITGDYSKDGYNGAEFIANIAEQGGGAISINNSSADISHLQFENNYLLGSMVVAGGGAILAENGLSRNIRFDNVGFSKNSSYIPGDPAIGIGGAILLRANTANSTIELKNNYFSENMSDLGGAIAANGNENGSSPALWLQENNYFRNSGSSGPGAIYLNSQPYVTLISEIFYQNSTHADGSNNAAAIYVKDTAPMVSTPPTFSIPSVLQCIFYENSFQSPTTHDIAGAIGSYNSSLRIHNNLFFDPQPTNGVVAVSTDQSNGQNLEMSRNLLSNGGAMASSYETYFNFDFVLYTSLTQDLTDTYNRTIVNPSGTFYDSSPPITTAADLMSWRIRPTVSDICPLMVAPGAQSFMINKSPVPTPTVTLPSYDITGTIGRSLSAIPDIGPYEYQ